MVIVFGGSFNPPTCAHLEIIKTLLITYPDSTVLVLPVGNDYQKPELVSFVHRYEMLKRLIKDLDRVYISDLESKKTYNGTLESLNELSKSYSNIHFVIGSDNLLQFETWINYKELLKSYPFIVMTRKRGLNKQQAEVLFKDYEHQFIYMPFQMDIESSKIRSAIFDKKNELTKEVFDYIQKNHLYGA